MEGTPPHVHRSSRHRFIHVLLFTGVIYLRVNHVGPIMEEMHSAEMLSYLKRIADTLERLLKIMEMRP